MRRLSWLFLCLGLGLGVCTPALAQTEPRIEVSAMVGYLFGGHLWEPVTGGPDLSVGDHLDYGVRAGWRADPHWEFEFDWTHVPTRLEFTHGLAPVSLDIDYVGPLVVYHFCTGWLRPYVAGGLGAAIFNTDETNSYFTGTFAVGLKAFVTPNIGARIEARGFASGVGDPPLGFPCTDFVTDPDTMHVVPVSCAHEWILNGDVTAGVVFAF